MPDLYELRTDEELVETILAGRSELFGELYARFQPRAFRMAYGMVGDRDSAADLTQEIFMRTFQRLDRYHGKSAFSTWFYRLAVNTCLNYRTRERKHKSGTAGGADLLLVPGSPYLEDASVQFQEALAEIDFRGGGTEALKTVLAEARTRDAFTLWHLLPRLAMPDRARAYERMASLVPAPAGVTREGVLDLDRVMLDSWREAVESASVGADPRLMPTATGSIQPVGSMNAARFAHTATLLKQGGVLITGGREVPPAGRGAGRVARQSGWQVRKR